MHIIAYIYIYIPTFIGPSLCWTVDCVNPMICNCEVIEVQTQVSPLLADFLGCFRACPSESSEIYSRDALSTERAAATNLPLMHDFQDCETDLLKVICDYDQGMTSSHRGRQTLQEFRIDKTKSQCCALGHKDPVSQSELTCDREILMKCICEWFGTVAHLGCTAVLEARANRGSRCGRGSGCSNMFQRCSNMKLGHSAGQEF